MFFAGKKGWNVLFFNVSDTSLTIWGDRLRIGDQQFFLSAVWLGGAQFCISATSFPTFIHSRSKMMDNLETYKKIYELFTSHLQNIFINIHQYSSIFLSRKMVGYDGVELPFFLRNPLPINPPWRLWPGQTFGNQGLLRAPQTIGPVVSERTQLGWGYIYIIYWMGFWQLTWLDRSIGHLELFGVIYIYILLYI